MPENPPTAVNRVQYVTLRTFYTTIGSLIVGFGLASWAILVEFSSSLKQHEEAIERQVDSNSQRMNAWIMAGWVPRDEKLPRVQSGNDDQADN